MAEAKLASSGITMEQAEELGITWHSAAETRDMDPSFWAVPSLKLPYFDPDHPDQPMKMLPNWPDFYRVRALREPPPFPDGKVRKYLNPPKIGVGVYFPRILNWTEICDDWRHDIIITEGELKAAKGALEGFNVIGLGGVNSYGSMRANGIELLPCLERIVWARRRVIIAFDSDLRSNENVCLALQHLADLLAERGARPRILVLPAVEEGVKVGLDDFLVANPPSALTSLIKTAEPLTLAQTLFSLNDRYAFVKGMTKVVVRNRAKLRTLSREDFGSAITDRYSESVLGKDGEVSYQRTPAAKSWLEWPLRLEVEEVTYSPGEKPFGLIQSRDNPNGVDYNSWTGWACEPKAGDVSLFLKVIDHFFSTAPEEHKKWFLQWLAYPIQHPGSKLATSVVIQSIGQGIGKSMIGYTMGKIYGRNFTEINQQQLEGRFNEWALGKQLVMGDDITGTNKRQHLDMLKKLITQKEMLVDSKNEKLITIPDCVNYLWTTNQPDAFYFEDNDRRFFVHSITAPPLPTQFFEVDYHNWLHGPECGPSMFHFLLNVDLTGFGPYGRAPETSAKQSMRRDSRSDLANWLRDMLENPDEHLVMGSAPMEGDLFTSERLAAAYMLHAGEGAEKIGATRMGRELGKADVRQVLNGGKVSLSGQKTDRYYAVRNREMWAAVTDLKTVQAHLQSPAGTTKPAPTKKKY